MDIRYLDGDGWFIAGAGIGQVIGVAGMGPWIAAVQQHGPHLARNVQRAHIQVIVRLYGQYTGKNLNIYIPGKNGFININIH